MQTSEQELIALSKQQDADAYGQLVERYKEALYRHCFAIVRDEDAAEDIAQDAFIAAYYKISTFDSSKRFSTWLFKIATNKALNAIRSIRHSSISDTMLTSLVSHHDSQVTQAENAELRQIVNSLSPRYRAVIHLHYFEGLSYEEMAVALNKPIGSVKGWMNRAKAQLRKELV